MKVYGTTLAEHYGLSSSRIKSIASDRGWSLKNLEGMINMIVFLESRKVFRK